MGTIHKIIQDGSTIFPATVTDAVVHPDLSTVLTDMITEYNVSILFPTGGTGGTNIYTLTGAIGVLNTNLTNDEKVRGVKVIFYDSASSIKTYYFTGSSYSNFNTTSYWTSTPDFMGVDDGPTSGSDNLVKSGGVAAVNGFYIQDCDYIRVVTDADDRILFGIKRDGCIEWSKGVPTPVKEYVIEKINEIISGEESMAEIFSVIKNQEPVGEITSIQNDEFVWLIVDSSDHILLGVREDGTVFFNGVPDGVKEYIRGYAKDFSLEYSEHDFLVRTREQFRLASNLGFAKKSLPSGWITPLTFLHISDTHGNAINHYHQMEHAILALNKLSTGSANEGRNASFLIHTGDIHATYYSDDFTYFTESVQYAKKPVFIAIGNHDAGNTTTIANCGTDDEIYVKMIEPYIEDWNLATPNGGTSHPSGKNYYFKDFTNEKIRFIVLYEFESDAEIDPNDNTKYKYNRGYRAFRQEQINWLIDSLQTTPDDYGVVIAKHQRENYRGTTDTPFNAKVSGNSGEQTFVSLNMIPDIVNAFIHKTHLQSTYAQTGGVVTTLDVNADFTSKTSTEFICYVSGHQHCDGISFLRDYPEQLELNVGCDNAHYTLGSDILQEEGTLSEDIINVYSIDRNNKCVVIARLGADFSNTAQQRIGDVIRYKNV